MKKILIIDDDENVRRFLRIDLEEAGYDVCDAENGKVGLALAAKAPFDLVITDIFMPEKDGIETVMELKRNWPEIKIMTISGGARDFSNQHYLTIVKKLGADRCMEKPFTSSQLRAAVQELLQE